MDLSSATGMAAHILGHFLATWNCGGISNRCTFIKMRSRARFTHAPKHSVAMINFKSTSDPTTTSRVLVSHALVEQTVWVSLELRLS